MVDTQRYWDGQRWTDHIAPGRPASAQPSAAEVAVNKARFDQVHANDRTNTWWVGRVLLALVIPILGLIAGLFELRKSAARGFTIIGISIAAGVVTAVVVTQVISPATADTPYIESQIHDWLLSESDLNIEGAHVDCPDNVRWRTGGEFHCVADVTGGGENTSVAITVHMETDDGEFTMTLGD
jgi:hypothetical protein